MRILGLVMALGLCAPSVAAACGNEVHLTRRQEVRAVARAEKLLEKRKYRRAIRTLIGLYESSMRADRTKRASTDPLLYRRALRVGAVATMRSDGLISPNFWRKIETTKAAMRKNLVWARWVLEQAHAKAPDDPGIAAQYAEALAKTGKPADALTRLEALAKDDLITEAETWRLLADLRAGRGDTAGRDAAMTRCEATATDKAICRPTS